MPIDQHYARILGNKKLNYAGAPPVPASKAAHYALNISGERSSFSPLRHSNHDLNMSGGALSGGGAVTPVFTKETHQTYMQTWDLIAITERAIESIRKRLTRKTDFSLEKAFGQLDFGRPKAGFITIMTVSNIPLN